MNVSEVMTRNTSACEPADSLERAAAIMWDRDCGVVPVVDGTGALHGIITDRDVAMSAYLKGRPLSTISVGEVMSRALHCCSATDPVERALSTMRQFQVHRMPVVDGDGRLTGMLAMADLLQATNRIASKQRQPLAEAIIETLMMVRKPRVEAPLPAATNVGSDSVASVMATAVAKPAATTPTTPTTTAAKVPPPTIGNPVAGTKATATPAAGAQASSGPAAGAPGTGKSAPSAPVTGAPATGNPASGASATGNPATGQSAKPGQPSKKKN